MDFNTEVGFFAYLIDWLRFSGDSRGPSGDGSNTTTGPIAG